MSELPPHSGSPQRYHPFLIDRPVERIAKGMVYNYDMKQQHVTTKIWLSTLRKLRLIAVITDETMVAALDRIATGELARLKESGSETVLEMLAGVPGDN